MAAEFMAQLEAAAKVMLAPPSVITPAQRHAAEQAFLSFRITKAPYALCKEILETCTVDYVLFETASTLKEALIREWKDLPPDEVNELRQYLFNYVVQKPNLRPYVRERILQVIAIMIKRHSVTDFGIERGKLLSEVGRLIMEGDLARQLLGCSIISAIIQEYSNTVKSSDIGLVWESHFTLKKDFEKADLKKILQLGIGALMEVVKLPLPFSENAQTLLKALLSVCETVLNWGFHNVRNPRFSRVHKRIVNMFERSYEAEMTPSLKLNSNWTDLIMDPNVTNLFFDVYWKIRDSPHLAHHAMSCLTQLASLNGPIFSSAENENRYFTNYVQSFVKLVTSIEVLDREALGVSNIISNLTTHCQLVKSSAAQLTPELMQSFLEQVTRLTVYFAEGAANEESVLADDCLFTEAFENLLKVWVNSPNNSTNPQMTEEFCNQASAQIFNIYLRSHLSPPDGSRGTGRELDAEEIEEGEEIDRIKFQSQLQSIAVLASQVPNHAVPLLVKLLEMRISTLHSNLERIHCNTFNISDSNILGCLFEDLHWLLLISGHVIAMETHGETPLIPSQMLSFSVNQKADVDASLKVLASSMDLNSLNPETVESSDHIIRLISSVFKLCEIEKKVVEANMSHLLSPLVSATLMWFLRHWSLSYLLPNCDYEENSPALKAAFGANSEGALWTVNFLLRKVESNLRAFSSEPTIVEESVELLVSLVDLRDKASFVLKSEGFWRLNELYRTLDTRLLPSSAKRGLMRAFTLGGAGIEDASEREEYWLRIIKPAVDKMQSIVGQERFKNTYQDEAVRCEIVNSLESFIGVAQGAQVATVHSIFALLSPVLNEGGQLLGLYCNYQLIVELILEFYLDCARGFVCFLTQDESARFYQHCLSAVQYYAKSNRGKRTVEACAEEDAYNDILLLMELLSNLQSKDYCDLSPPGEEINKNGPQITGADVCLYGLRILMPLMTVDLLKFPNLCLKYYKLITFLCELNAGKVLSLDAELLSSIFSTIQMGLHTFGKEVSGLCCTFVQVLASHICDNGLQTSFLALIPFISFFMEMILGRHVNSSVLPNCGTALFVLMCCYQDEYRAVVHRWISMQTDPVVAERLAKAFTDLTADLSLNPRSRSNFQTRFDTFLAEVHGFLLVK